ncbi:MAG: C1 family peptidase [Polyangiaceae bacterium]
MKKNVITWWVVALAAGALTGCQATAGDRNTDDEDVGESDLPPIDPGEKYIKPGPVLATPDDGARKERFDYHQEVIAAHQFTYVIRDNPAMHMEIEELTGLVIPEDAGEDKPKTQQSYKNMTLPAKWDSREEGVGLPPIRNQGSCGSCWAFGSVAAVEAAIAMYDHQIVNLSEQFVLDCSGKGTCGGGYWAYNVFKSPGGAMEQEYPYTGYDMSCKSSKVSHPYKIESYHSIASNDREGLKAAIYQHGAVGVTMSVCGSIPGYGGGVYDSTECNWAQTNHIVALVGWDDNVQHKKGKGAWIMRNSWGEKWGNKGYALMAYGTARLEEGGTYVVYKPEDPTDTDADGVTDLHDNCKTTPNADQADLDEDGAGDACDSTFDPFEKALSLSDDDSRKVDLGFAFSFFGTAYTSVYINSDGNLTFGQGDGQSENRSVSRFLTLAPRIAALYADLNPSAGGKVLYGKPTPDTFVVKYDNVPLYGKSGGNSVTVKLDASGNIAVTVLGVSAADYVVGVSKGGQGNTASESDLSAQLSQPYAGSKAVFQSFGSGKPFDLTGKTVTFSASAGPLPEPDPNDPEPQPKPEEPTEITLSLGDDDSKPVELGFSFPYFGASYSKVYVNSDGNLTFGQGDGATAERSASRFLTNAPRIGVLYGDLDPSSSGVVTVRHEDAESVTIKYQGVPLWGQGGAGSTASVTLHSSGKITLAYGSVSGSSYIAGLSAGGSGNTGVTLDLSAQSGDIGYGGDKTLYELFGKGKSFDLSGKTLVFSPGESVDPDPGPAPDVPSETSISLADDGSKSIALGFSFPFFGKEYTQVYVNSDGNLTFGQGDSSTADRNLSRFLTGAPRVAVLYADLDPSKSGAGVSYTKTASSVTIAYTAVPVWGQSGASTVNVTLDASGAITMTMGVVAAPSFIVGVSKGGSGNSGQQVDLLSGDVHYDGNGAVYQSFGSFPFVLDGAKITFVK